MRKEKTIFNGDLSINVEAIRAAASNASKVQDIALEVPVVDPKMLSIDDQIFGVVLNPSNDKAKLGPNTTMYPAIKNILVDTLSGRAKEGYITVNGTIDIPKEGGKVTKLENSYFASQADAQAVCVIITEVELDRAMERLEDEQRNIEFLKNQLANGRF